MNTNLGNQWPTQNILQEQQQAFVRIKTLNDYYNPKRAMSKHIQEQNIDKGNRILFKKILDIYSKPKRTNSVSGTNLPTTLNLRNRIQFQQKIAVENLKLYERIRSQSSEYKTKKILQSTLYKPNKLPQCNRPNSVFNQLQQKILKQIKLTQTSQTIYRGVHNAYEITMQVDGNTFIIKAKDNESQQSKVLEISKADGLRMVKTLFNNNLSKLAENIVIGDRIEIKDLELQYDDDIRIFNSTGHQL